MEPQFKPDLHCHSHFSDGKHSPEQVLAKAVANKISHLAITDHDCVEACRHLPVPAPLTLVPGVEISCQWDSKEIHLVGLCIDIDDAGLTALLARQQDVRRERLRRYDSNLQKLGIHGLQEWVGQQACIAITRTHIADFLVAGKHSKNHQKAFKQYLSRRGKAWVSADWCSIDEAVATLHAAGGIAVLAHPGRYPLGRSRLRQLLTDFCAAGGDGMETSYANIEPQVRTRLAELATEFNLYQSLGSDFHSEEAHWTDIGKFPALGEAAKKNAIWLHPRWHSFKD